MQLLRRNGAITLYFKVNIFRLSRQLEPGKVCGYVQIVDIAEYLGRFKLVLNLLQFLPVYRRPLQISGKPAAGVSLEQAEAAVRKELEELQRSPVDGQELEKVRTSLNLPRYSAISTI